MVAINDDTKFFIADLRPEWRGNPYVTFWRPDDAGYAHPLPWSGRYSKQDVDDGGSYYYGSKGHGRQIHRFPVPCHVVERLSTAKPAAHMIDGDVGPVVPNTTEIKKALKAARYKPATIHPKGRAQ